MTLYPNFVGLPFLAKLLALSAPLIPVLVGCLLLVVVVRRFFNIYPNKIEMHWMTEKQDHLVQSGMWKTRVPHARTCDAERFIWDG